MNPAPFESLNLIANLLTIVGVGVALFILVQAKRIAERLEQVMAPRLGIEGYLTMCGQVIEADPDGTCVVNDSGEIVMVNRRLEDISGYHRSELVGESVETLVPASSRIAHVIHREGFTMRPSSRPMRGLSLQHKRGGEIPVEIRLNRYTDATGGFTIAKVRVPEA